MTATCAHCKGRGYHNVRGSGPAAFRGGWKRRPCACSVPKPKAAPPRTLTPTPPDLWEPLWLAYLRAASAQDPRRKVHGSPAGLLAVREVVRAETFDEVIAMLEAEKRESGPGDAADKLAHLLTTKVMDLLMSKVRAMRTP